MTETYYQQTFILSCQSLLCDLTLPKFATGQRLILRNISCIMNSAGRAVYGKLDFKYQGSLSVQQFFRPIHDDGIFSADLDVLIAAQKVANITLVASANTSSAHCSLIGRLQVFS